MLQRRIEWGGGQGSGGPAPVSLGKPLAFDGQARDQEEDTPVLSTLALTRIVAGNL